MNMGAPWFELDMAIQTNLVKFIGDFNLLFAIAVYGAMHRGLLEGCPSGLRNWS
jgi:hypothetical protein